VVVLVIGRRPTKPFKGLLPQKVEEYGKEALRQIIPIKDPLKQLEEGEKSYEELLDEATIKLNEKPTKKGLLYR